MQQHRTQVSEAFAHSLIGFGVHCRVRYVGLYEGGAGEIAFVFEIEYVEHVPFIVVDGGCQGVYLAGIFRGYYD